MAGFIYSTIDRRSFAIERISAAIERISRAEYELAKPTFALRRLPPTLTKFMIGDSYSYILGRKKVFRLSITK